MHTPIGIYLSCRFARTIALKTLRWKTKPTRTETVNSKPGRQSRSFERMRLHRKRRSLIPIRITALAPCVYAPRFQLCAGNRSNRNTKEVLLNASRASRLSYFASNNCNILTRVDDSKTDDESYEPSDGMVVFLLLINICISLMEYFLNVM